MKGDRKTKFADKIILISSLETPIAKKLFKKGRFKEFKKDSFCSDVLGVTKVTINNWIRDGDAPGYSLNRFVERLNQQFSEIGNWKIEDFDDAFSTYHFAERLGLEFEETQRLLDFEKIIQRKNYPFFIHELEASKYNEQYNGLYYMFHIYPGTAGADLVVRSTLRVRYMVGQGERTAIRCKLNVPIYESETPANLNYDGFLSRKEQCLFWLFESRVQGGNKINDSIQFATKQASKQSSLMHGFYISASEKFNLFLSPVVLLKHSSPDNNNASEIINFMHNQQKIYPGGVEALEDKFSAVKNILKSEVKIIE
ncbi:hypothetical protein FLL45_00300 [Aliikangiella marina]|uniref:Uncharacterized protein n=1 Tax=Aliikangiella marina TaxID=1712262 RepID=A0A545TGT3_9GAMM|nr:hypothetical protein [Aliikangiella marina]TQV76442.1 hypothetical protein FLL45_00300 [Aliikangiella marina]